VPYGQTLTLNMQLAGGFSSPISLTAGRTIDQALQENHLTYPILYNTYIWLGTLLTGCFFCVSLWIFIRRSDDWLAILTSITLLILPSVLSQAPQIELGVNALGLYILWDSIIVLGLLLGAIMIIVFPNGRLYPKWSKFVLVLAAIVAVINHYGMSLPPAANVGINLLLLCLVGTLQVVRYHKSYNPVEKQQTKWVIVSFILLVIGFFFYFITSHWNLFHFSSHPEIVLISYFAVGTALLFFAISIAIAIMKYKLWDADFYINTASW
jgi:hypothetical protein